MATQDEVRRCTDCDRPLDGYPLDTVSCASCDRKAANKWRRRGIGEVIGKSLIIHYRQAATLLAALERLAQGRMTDSDRITLACLQQDMYRLGFHPEM